MTRIALSYEQNPANEEILKSLNSLYNQHFYPTFLCNHNFLQIFMAAVFSDKPSIYQRETITLSDGGQIVLDWALPKKQIEYTGTHLSGRYYPYEPAKDNKILLILHGLTGGSETAYVQTLVEDGVKRGYRVAVLNQRGINQPLTSPKTFHGGLIEDLAVGIEQIRKNYPDAPLMAIGTSFGGNQLLRYLSQEENKKNILGAVLLSPPFSSDSVADHIQKTVFETFFIKHYFEKCLLPNFDMLQSLKESHGVNLEEVLKQTDIREFHKTFTMKMYGHKDIEDYFKTMRIHKSHIDGVQTPMLIVHAKDDPICAHKSVPVKTLASNPNIIVAETNRGGHMCWISGLKPERVRFTLNIFC